jgi:hypothetical protein
MFSPKSYGYFKVGHRWHIDYDFDARKLSDNSHPVIEAGASYTPPFIIIAIAHQDAIAMEREVFQPGVQLLWCQGSTPP